MAVIVLTALVASLFGVDSSRSPESDFVALHQDAHAHGRAPMPLEFSIQAGPTDPTGREDSGGVAITHHAGAVRITSGRAVDRAPDARLYRTGFGAWEPTMGVTKKGNVYINGSDAEGDPAILA